LQFPAQHFTGSFNYLHIPPWHRYLLFPLLADSSLLPLLAISITCRSHPYNFTPFFHCLQFPAQHFYWQFKLLVHSTLTILLAFSIACSFQISNFTGSLNYLQMLAHSSLPPLLAISSTCRFFYLQTQRPPFEWPIGVLLDCSSPYVIFVKNEKAVKLIHSFYYILVGLYLPVHKQYIGYTSFFFACLYFKLKCIFNLFFQITVSTKLISLFKNSQYPGCRDSLFY